MLVGRITCVDKKWAVVVVVIRGPHRYSYSLKLVGVYTEYVVSCEREENIGTYPNEEGRRTTVETLRVSTRADPLEEGMFQCSNEVRVRLRRKVLIIIVCK